MVYAFMFSVFYLYYSNRRDRKPLHSRASACAPAIKCDGADCGAYRHEQAHADPHPRGSSAAIKRRKGNNDEKINMPDIYWDLSYRVCDCT